MAATTLKVLGRDIRPIERIPVAGRIIGLPSRSTSYRMAESDHWPLVGPESSRWVLMIPLLEKYGIPYTIDSSAPVGVTDGTTLAHLQAEGR